MSSSSKVKGEGLRELARRAGPLPSSLLAMSGSFEPAPEATHAPVVEVGRTVRLGAAVSAKIAGPTIVGGPSTYLTTARATGLTETRDPIRKQTVY